MMQHLIALFLPAFPQTRSGMLMALAAFLAGALLAGMVLAAAVKLACRRGGAQVIVSTSSDPDVLKARARSARSRR